MGDFNSYPETLPITKIKTYFEDGLTVSKKSLKGPFGTFNGFSSKQKLDKNRIDYIFTKNIHLITLFWGFGVLGFTWNKLYPQN